MSARELRIEVPGEPRGRERARSNGRFRFHSPEQDRYDTTIQGEWIAAGRPVLCGGAYAVVVTAYMTRPASHFKVSGALSAAGLRAAWPTKRPDADNLLKQIDALVAVGALPDDAAMVSARVSKRWADPEHPPALVICAWTYDLAGIVEAAA